MKNLRLSNNTTRWTLLTIIATGLTGIVAWEQMTPGASADEPTQLAHFMRKKLDASSSVLEGLTTKNAALIRKGTDTLLKMSKSEVWNVLSDADYREFNSEYRSALKKLDDAGATENYDNALLQWFDVMKSCVECHKYVRDQRATLKP